MRGNHAAAEWLRRDELEPSRAEKCAEAGGDQSQTLAGRMRCLGMRIRGTYNFAKQHKCGIGMQAFLQDRTERDILAVVSQLAAGDVEGSGADCVRTPFHLRYRNEEELRLRINEPFDQPRARHAINLHSLSRDPSHGVTSGFTAACASSAAFKLRASAGAGPRPQ